MVNGLLTKDYKYKVKQMLESQKGVISEVIKRKSTVMPSMSWGAKKETAPQTKYSGFPLKFFEDQTYLERIAEWFTTAPFYLSQERLQKTKDSIERMKLVVTMVMSTLYMTVKPSKPFNPILGETYEGFMCLNNKEKEKEIEGIRNNTYMSPSAQMEVFKVYLE